MWESSTNLMWSYSISARKNSKTNFNCPHRDFISDSGGVFLELPCSLTWNIACISGYEILRKMIKISIKFEKKKEKSRKKPYKNL